MGSWPDLPRLLIFFCGFMPTYHQCANNMEEYQKEAIRFGLSCLYMTDLSLKESQAKAVQTEIIIQGV